LRRFSFYEKELYILLIGALIIGVLCIWCILVLAVKWIKTHNIKAKQVIDGKALIIIDDGKINIENYRKKFI